MIIELASIIQNHEIARGIWKMVMNCKNMTKIIQGPGQFINIQVESIWEIPLRRPMSIADVEGEEICIIYKLFGKGTRLLSIFRPRQLINILGPLGNTFQYMGNNSNFPILIGGGIGIAPILWLHNEMKLKSINHILIIGATTVAEHFLNHSPDQNVILTTDDGSIGEHGTVIPAMENRLKEVTSPIIYACGPIPMLKSIHAIVMKNQIDCQMALESYMGCGIGICQSCVVKRKNDSPEKHSYGEQFSLVCKNGPVFPAEKIIL